MTSGSPPSEEPSGGSWTPWAPRSADQAQAAAPGGGDRRHRRSAPPTVTTPSASAPPPGAPGRTPWGTSPPAPGPSDGSVPWSVPPRAPVADDRRPPGSGSQPPLDWPAPRFHAPLTDHDGPRRSPALVGFVAFVAGALLVGAAFAAYALGDRRSAGGDGDDRGGREVAAGTSERLDVRRILDIAQPSVVSIQTGSSDSIFGGAGSGVVISEDGLILTNAHVIEGAAGAITVRFHDGVVSSAELVGASTDDDIALIRADRQGLTPATLGSSANLRVGDDVVAIGNALGLSGDPSVTSGIVSAKDRSIDDGQISLDHLIQTDAAINPGNSGGPLVDADGEVVGINTAIIDGAQNVGFSLAIDEVEALLPELQAGGGDLTPDTAVLGVAAVTVDGSLDPATRDEYGVTGSSGALITQVDGGSGAAQAGLEVGDVVIEVDRTPIATNQDLTAAVRSHEPGDRVEVTVERRGELVTLPVELGGN